MLWVNAAQHVLRMCSASLQKLIAVARGAIAHHRLEDRLRSMLRKRLRRGLRGHFGSLSLAWSAYRGPKLKRELMIIPSEGYACRTARPALFTTLGVPGQTKCARRPTVCLCRAQNVRPQGLEGGPGLSNLPYGIRNAGLRVQDILALRGVHAFRPRRLARGAVDETPDDSAPARKENWGMGAAYDAPAKLCSSLRETAASE